LLNSVTDLTTFLACSILSFIINHLSDSGTNLENVRINVNQETTKTKLMVRVLNLTFNYISVISWRSVLLVEETGVPWENYRTAASHRQTLSHNVAWNTPHLHRILTHNVSSDRHRSHR
jgi:hypothetical protein